MTQDTALAKIERSQAPPPDLGHFLEVVKPEIARILPAHINPETLLRVVQTFGSQDDRFLKCTESSVFASLVMCSQLGLPPNTPQGFAWLIPFWNGRQKVMECKVMFGKNGLAELVRNSGQILRMNSGVVYKHEVTSGAFTHSNEPPTITHRSDVLAAPELYADENLVAAYALIETKDGGRVQRVLRRHEVLKRRDASQAVQRAKEKGYRTPWDDWEGPMWTKTAIRALCGMPEVPKSTNLMTALEHDIDSPPFDEVHNVVVSQADGFRQQAAMAAPATVALPPGAAPAEEPPGAPPADDSGKKGKTGKGKPKGPKMATKTQTARLWSRWAKIMDVNPKTPGEDDTKNFVGFASHLIEKERAGESSKWTAEDYEKISKALDMLRDSPPAEPPAADGAKSKDAGEPGEAGEGEGAAGDEQEQPPDPGISKTEALKQLKDLRQALDMGWEDVRTIAIGIGVTARASAKWTAAECLAVADEMRAEADKAPADPESDGQVAKPDPELGEEPPPHEDDDAPPDLETDDASVARAAKVQALEALKAVRREHGIEWDVVMTAAAPLGIESSNVAEWSVEEIEAVTESLEDFVEPTGHESSEDLEDG